MPQGSTKLFSVTGNPISPVNILFFLKVNDKILYSDVGEKPVV